MGEVGLDPDVGAVCPDGVPRDQHPLEKRERVAVDQRPGPCRCRVRPRPRWRRGRGPSRPRVRPRPPTATWCPSGTRRRRDRGGRSRSRTGGPARGIGRPPPAGLRPHRGPPSPASCRRGRRAAGADRSSVRRSWLVSSRTATVGRADPGRLGHVDGTPPCVPRPIAAGPIAAAGRADGCIARRTTARRP
jgi:hypothetical protein